MAEINPTHTASQEDIWPSLPWETWQDTCNTLHLWTQIIGKIRLELTPKINHCWEVPLYVTARGLTTSPIPYKSSIFQIDFDFLANEMQVIKNNGEIRSIKLRPMSVAEFYQETMTALNSLGIEINIWTTPVEIPDRTPFERDTKHNSYDLEYVRRFWKVLVQVDRVLKLSWRFIVVKEQKNKDKLRACAFDQPQVSQAPVVLICCGDRRVNNTDYIEEIIQIGITVGRVNEKYAEYMRGAIPQLFEYKPSFESMEAWTNRHTMLAVAHLMIVAKAFGVDSCPMEGFVAGQVKEAFNIPAEVDVYCLLPLGYADEPSKKYGGRFSTECVCYGESFGQAL